MKYSTQQIQDINREYENLKRQIKLTNKMSKANQNVLIDKQLPEDLIDRRNHNDIENDMFARRALMNDYSNELITSGSPYEFTKLVYDEGYDEFFLNNFPKIKTEAKMYRIQNSKNMFDLIKRLYNRYERESKYLENSNYLKTNDSSILASLNSISKNLKTILKQLILCGSTLLLKA